MSKVNARLYSFPAAPFPNVAFPLLNMKANHSLTSEKINGNATEVGIESASCPYSTCCKHYESSLIVATSSHLGVTSLAECWELGMNGWLLLSAVCQRLRLVLRRKLRIK